MSNVILVKPLELGIVSVTFNRPDRRNALSIDVLEQLADTIEKLAADAATRVVILRGEGPIFSAGLDLHEAADDTLVDKSAAAVSRAFNVMRSTPLVTIALVQGGAFAGGAGVMAACDIAIAASDAKIGFPEIRRGLLPALIGDVLVHRVREGDLRELLLVGDPIDAVRAQQVGLVQRVVPADRLLEEALAVARLIVSGGPETVRQTKSLLNAMFEPPVTHTVTNLINAHLTARYSEEAREGLAAFAEKREPNW